MDISCSPINRSRKEVYLTPNKRSHPNNIDQLSKMIENCVKMECSGCRKLIPTHLFYDHITTNN
jgi:hypothetical protein